MSGNVVDISRRFNAPDGSQTYKDANGTTYYKFLFEYDHNGTKWGFDVWARDRKDALEKVKSLAATHVFKGQVILEVPQ